MSRRTRLIIRQSLESVLNGVEDDENREYTGQNLLERLQDMSPTSRSNVLSRLREIFEIRTRRRLYDDYSVDEDMENAIYNSNENFKQFSKENDINFRNYPFPINWVEIENDENEYYYILSKYGYFGVSIYTQLNKIKKVTLNNLIVLIAEMFSSFLKKESVEKLKEFIFSLPQTPEMIYKMIKNKFILVKEIPVYLIMLIIYEIFYFSHDNEQFNNYNNQKLILKSQYTLINMINDDEYKTIYDDSFKGKPIQILSKLNYNIKKERKKYLQHINKMNNDLLLMKSGFDIEKFSL
jgi:hypothetical protein